jgi:ribosomal protein L21
MLSDILQESRCKHCDVLIDTKTVKSNRGLPVRRERSCKSCSRKNASKAKIGPLNPNWSGGKTVYTEDEKKAAKILFCERARKRMIENNPMVNPEVRAKVRSTVKRKIKNGLITYKRGKDHHRWKGNRKSSFTLRTRVKPWTKSVLSRDGFKCTKCGRKRGLEVHHIRPFKEIVNICVKRLNVLPLNKMAAESDNFERLAADVVKEHKLVDGITLCRKCHAEVDSLRRIGRSAHED